MSKQFVKILTWFLLIFTICSYAKSNLHFDINGINGEPLTNIQARLNDVRKDYGETLSPLQAHKIYGQGKIAVKKALEPYGFFRASIAGQLINQNGIWLATYNVTPGEPLRVTSIQTLITGDGANNSALQKYIRSQPIKKNSIFSTVTYNKFKTKLFTIAKNNGYIHAFFHNKIIVDLKNYTSRILVNLDTGPRFYFGEIIFKTHPYSENFMKRCFTFQPGEVFSSLRILKLQQQMEQSYYFKRAVLIPQFKDIQNFSVPIEAYLTAPKPELYSVGVGYGTLTGPRLSGKISWRHLGDNGQHLEVEAKLSSILAGVGATYYIPGQNPLTDEWHGGINYKHFNPKSGVSNSISVAGGYSRKFETWQSNISLNYLIDRFLIFGEPPSQSPHELFPSWKISYINADNLSNPHNAYSINLVTQAASHAVLSTTDFAQLQTRGKIIMTPVSFARIILRGDLGLTAVHNLPVFPFSLRFFAGGVNSIRGFADSSIGPGKYLAIASAEYQNRIKGDLFGAVFYDTGYATNHFSGALNRGAGIGAIYDTRIGPIKIYLARALSKQTKPFSVEFSMGPEFS